MQELTDVLAEQSALLDRLAPYLNDRDKAAHDSISRRLMQLQSEYQAGNISTVDARKRFAQIAAEITALCERIEGKKMFF